METLIFHVDTDRRNLAGTMDDNVLSLDWHDDNKYSWIQARQYENSMRQVIVKVYQGPKDSYVPMNLTNTNQIFEGVMPDGKHRVYDTKHSTLLDPASGEFRFDFPAQVFAVAGSYKQAFFRIVREGTGENIATLEFNMDVMADKVVSGLIASDYITPFNDLYSKLETIVNNASGDLEKFKNDWNTKIQAMLDTYAKDFNDLQKIITNLQSRIEDIASEVKANNIVTFPMLARYAGCPVMIGIAHFQLGKDANGMDDLYPAVHAYASKYGAGIGGAGEVPAGGTAVYDVNVRAVRNEPTEVEIFVSPDNVHSFLKDLDMSDPDASFGGSFAYVYSGIFTIALEFKGATVTKFDVASDFVADFKDTQTTA